MAATISYAVSVADYFSSDASKTNATPVSWNAGDVIVIVAVGENGQDNGVDTFPNLPANANLTFSVLEDASTSASGNDGAAKMWAAVAGSSQTNQTISLQRYSSSFHWGFITYVVGSASAVGNHTSLVNASADGDLSLTVQAGSAVLFGYSDWNALASPPGNPITGSGTSATDAEAGNGSSYGFGFYHWTNTAAGTFNFGISPTTGMDLTTVAVEVRASAGSPVTINPVESSSLSSSDTAQLTVSSPSSAAINPVKSTSLTSSDTAQLNDVGINKLRFGTITPLALKVGTTNVLKAYIGTTQVFGAATEGSQATINPLEATSVSTSDTAQLTASGGASAVTINPVESASISSSDTAQLTDGSWPNASNTGYLGDPGSLTAMSGGVQITTPGQIIEYRSIDDYLDIQAINVTIRHCVISAGYFGVVNDGGYSGLTVEDCTITGGANCGILTAGNNAVIQRNNVSGGNDGMKIGGDNVLVQDNYIHDLFNAAGDPDPHHDGVQCSSGTGITFEHNWIDAKDTSGIAMFEGQGTWSDVTVNNNYFTGTMGYAIYWPGASGSAPMECTNNVFDGPFGYDYVTDWNAAWTWSGNVDENGDPL